MPSSGLTKLCKTLIWLPSSLRHPNRDKAQEKSVEPRRAAPQEESLLFKSLRRSLLVGILALIVGLLSASAQETDDDGLLDLDLEALMKLEVVQVTIPGAHWHWEGDVMVGYQYNQSHWAGHLNGTEEVSDPEVLRQFPLTHERMTMHMHMLMFMYGKDDELTLMAMVPYMQMDMPHLSRANGTFTTRSEGLGDVRLSAIVPVYDEYPHRIQFEGGLSLPTGRIDIQDLNGRPGRLEYAMQLGSGTVDLRPALTYLGQTDDLSWGAQARGVFRVGENSAGYSQGNLVGLTAWISPAVTEEFSPSLRVDAKSWGNVRGVDVNISRSNPAAIPELQGGERIDLLLGINYAAGVDDEGRGHRFSIEGGVPIYQKLRGPQLKFLYQIGGAWQWTF